MNPDPLAQLRDYHVPEPVSWWPPAAGWWVLVFVALALLAAAAWWLAKRRANARSMRLARFELRAIRAAHAADADDTAAARALSRLLRRFILQRFPRRQVAGLTGDAWLAFLDAQWPERAFSEGPGKALTEAPFRSDARVSAPELIALVENWICRNPGAPG